MKCPDCASENVTEVLREYPMLCGDSVFDPHPIAITVSHPAFFCEDCRAGWFDYRGEEARAKALEIYRSVQAEQEKAALR
jgi:hypothetical protein